MPTFPLLPVNDIQPSTDRYVGGPQQNVFSRQINPNTLTETVAEWDKISVNPQDHVITVWAGHGAVDETNGDPEPTAEVKKVTFGHPSNGGAWEWRENIYTNFEFNLNSPTYLFTEAENPAPMSNWKTYIQRYGEYWELNPAGPGTFHYPSDYFLSAAAGYSFLNSVGYTGNQQNYSYFVSGHTVYAVYGEKDVVFDQGGVAGYGIPYPAGLSRRPEYLSNGYFEGVFKKIELLDKDKNVLKTAISWGAGGAREITTWTYPPGDGTSGDHPVYMEIDETTVAGLYIPPGAFSTSVPSGGRLGYWPISHNRNQSTDLDCNIIDAGDNNDDGQLEESEVPAVLWTELKRLGCVSGGYITNDNFTAFSGNIGKQHVFYDNNGACRDFNAIRFSNVYVTDQSTNPSGTYGIGGDSTFIYTLGQVQDQVTKGYLV